MEHALRTLALKLNVSGTAEVVNETKLYKNSYGFQKLQAYIPLTQNTNAPVCSVFCTTTDEFGVEKVSTNNYNMVYVGEVAVKGQSYLLFECYMPREFTAVATPPNGLKITINYYDTAPTLDSNGDPVIGENGNPMRHTTDLLVSSQYRTTVYLGGWNNEDIELGINSSESAQINQNTRDIAELIVDVTGLRNYMYDFDHNYTEALGEIHQRIDELENTTDQRMNEAEGAISDLQENKIDQAEKGAAGGVAPLGNDGLLDGLYILKGQPGGVATLNENGKVPSTQLDIPGTLEYQGTWNAATNTPNLDTVAKNGFYYKVSAAGDQYGEHWEIGDWIISNGVAWQKIDNSDVDAFTKAQSDARYLLKTDADAEAVASSIVKRTPTGQVKGAPAANPDEFVTKEQLDAISAINILKIADATVLVDQVGRPFEDENGRYIAPEYVDRWAREQISKIKEGN